MCVRRSRRISDRSIWKVTAVWFSPSSTMMVSTWVTRPKA